MSPAVCLLVYAQLHTRSPSPCCALLRPFAHTLHTRHTPTGARCQVVVFEERAVLRVMSANGAWALQTVYGFESHFYVMANPSPAQLEADQRDGMWRVDLDGGFKGGL